VKSVPLIAVENVVFELVNFQPDTRSLQQLVDRLRGVISAETENFFWRRGKFSLGGDSFEGGSMVFQIFRVEVKNEKEERSFIALTLTGSDKFVRDVRKIYEKSLRGLIEKPKTQTSYILPRTAD